MALTFVLPPSLGRAKATARAELIEAALARDLGEQVRAVVAETYGELEQRALDATAELLWAPAVVAAKLTSARALYTIVRGGRSSYRSALIARKSHGLALTGLGGTRAAWVDPLSAGGYLLATALLRARGIEPSVAFASQVFAGSHRAAVEAVLHETADVAAVSVTALDAESLAATLRWYAGPSADALTAIAVTESCRNDAIVITTKVAEADAAALAEKLALSTPAARARSRLLLALEAELLEPATLDDYRRLRALLWAEPERASAPHPPIRTERPRPR